MSLTLILVQYLSNFKPKTPKFPDFDEDEDLDQPQMGTRADKSLGLLAKRFIRMIQYSPYGRCDLNTVFLKKIVNFAIFVFFRPPRRSMSGKSDESTILRMFSKELVLLRKEARIWYSGSKKVEFSAGKMTFFNESAENRILTRKMTCLEKKSILCQNIDFSAQKA